MKRSRTILSCLLSSTSERFLSSPVFRNIIGYFDSWCYARACRLPGRKWFNSHDDGKNAKTKPGVNLKIVLEVLN